VHETQGKTKLNTKKLTFVIMMGALGNGLFVVSYAIGQIAPGVAIDLSLLAVFIAGIYAGPKAGFATGLIAGIIPGIMFGPAGTGGILGLIALPFGKGLTGLTVGLLATGLNLQNRPLKALIGIPVTLLAYIPEGLFTYAYFTALLPLFFGDASAVPDFIVSGIMIKAVIEVVIMSFIIAALLSNKAFSKFMANHFGETKITKKQIIKQ
jgi:riboflavin transporter FmnP